MELFIKDVLGGPVCFSDSSLSNVPVKLSDGSWVTTKSAPICIGHGVSRFTEGKEWHGCCPYDAKSLRFLDYVEHLGTEKRFDDMEFADCDNFRCYGHGVTVRPHGRSRACVTVDNRAFDCSNGVVFQYGVAWNIQSCCSLYEFMAMLCSWFDYNMMQYEKVYVTNREMSYRTTFGFVHTAEAERFFTKMLVMGD